MGCKRIGARVAIEDLEVKEETIIMISGMHMCLGNKQLEN
jgi:hypothetical protein